MELWKDQQRDAWHMLDAHKGQHFRCDRYGQPLKRFHVDATGLLNPKDAAVRTSTSYEPPKSPLDGRYAPQPSNSHIEKFDGYTQFPRPRSEVYFNDKHSVMRLKPVPRGQMPSNRLPDDIHLIPKPASFLTFSAVDDPAVARPVFRPAVSKSMKEIRPSALTVEGLRTTLVSTPVAVTKTVKDFDTKLEQEKRQMSGYQPPAKKPERRKLNGFFQLLYPTTGERFRKDMDLWHATNPVAFERQLHYEALDRKNLERRKEQRMLKNRLIM